MTTSTAINTYLRNKIMFAKPEELTCMLYDGIVKNLNQCILALQQNNIEKANTSLLKVQDIISELKNALNMEFPVSKNLDMIYQYMIERLIEANIKKDINIVNEILGYAIELRDTWKTACNLK